MIAVLDVVGQHHAFANLATFLLFFAVLTVLCTASYRLYESRFIALKGRFFTRRGPALAGAACGPLGSNGLAIGLDQGDIDAVDRGPAHQAEGAQGDMRGR